MRAVKTFFLLALGASGCTLIFDGSDLHGTNRADGGTGGDGGNCGAAATLSFAAPQPFPTGNAFPIHMAAGDLDHDGKTDVVVANFGDGSSTMPSAAVLWGLGAGGFAVPMSTSFANAHAVAIADFDGDQKLDFVVAGNDTGSPPSSNTLQVMLNRGGRVFAQQPALSDSGGPYAVTAADVDADGHMDLAVGNSYADSVTVFYGAGDGANFTAKPYIACSTARGCTSDALGIFQIAAADLDHNGLIDLVTTNNLDNTISTLINGGARMFSTDNVKNLPVGRNPAGLATADFNGDQFPDLVVGNAGANNVSVLLSGGGGYTTLPVDISTDVMSSSAGVAVADVNGDGILDIISANFDNSAMGNDPTADTVSVLLGRAGGTFQAAQPFPAGQQPSAIVVGDFNGDCRPDIVVANHLPSGSVNVLFNTSQ